jgi:hypothetical protein
VLAAETGARGIVAVFSRREEESCQVLLESEKVVEERTALLAPEAQADTAAVAVVVAPSCRLARLALASSVFLCQAGARPASIL